MNLQILEQQNLNQMRKEYDFSLAKPNPYIKKLRKQISVLDFVAGKIQGEIKAVEGKTE